MKWEGNVRFGTRYAGKLPRMPKPRVRAVRRRTVARKTTSKT